ncbi:MAG: hypothetical protein QME81_18765 [bacterium]|nr:hypothetical protein [bacterium]
MSLEKRRNILELLKTGKWEMAGEEQVEKNKPLKAYFPYKFRDKDVDKLEDALFPNLIRDIKQLAEILNNWGHRIYDHFLAPIIKGTLVISNQSEIKELSGQILSLVNSRKDEFLSISDEVSSPFLSSIITIFQIEKRNDFLNSKGPNSDWFKACVEFTRNYLYHISPKVFLKEWAEARENIILKGELVSSSNLMVTRDTPSNYVDRCYNQYREVLDC